MQVKKLLWESLLSRADTGDGPSSRSQNEGETVRKSGRAIAVMQAYAVIFLQDSERGLLWNWG